MTVAMIGGRLFQDKSCMKLDVTVYQAFLSMSLEVDNPYCMKNHFSKCGFPVENVYNNDDSALKLTKDEENVQHSSQSLGFQFEDYVAYDSGLEICGVTVSVRCWNSS